MKEDRKSHPSIPNEGRISYSRNPAVPPWNELARQRGPDSSTQNRPANVCFRPIADIPAPITLGYGEGILAITYRRASTNALSTFLARCPEDLGPHLVEALIQLVKALTYYSAQTMRCV